MALTLAIIPGITIKKPTTERIQDTTQDIIRRLIMVPAIQTITSMQTSMEGKGKLLFNIVVCFETYSLNVMTNIIS